MPWPAPKQCKKPGCPGLTHDRFCEAHQREHNAEYERRRGSASARGYGRKWRKLAAFILIRDPYCMADGCNEWSTEVDHIVPRRRGGTDDPSNLQGMCHDCHSAKTAKEDGRWGYAPQSTSHGQT